MRRREFITLVGGVAAGWPLAARAQHAPMRRLAVLVNGLEGNFEWQRWLNAFRHELEGLGWLEGSNIHIETRFSRTTSTAFHNWRGRSWRSIPTRSS